MIARQTVRACLTQAALLAVILAVIFPGVFLRGERLIPGAHFFDQAPWKELRPAGLPEQNPLGREVPTSVCVWFSVTNQAFDRGEWPLWSPLQFTGSPFLATFQASVFYPPRLIFRLFDDVWISATICILLRFWLCGFNAFVCSRALGLHLGAARFFSISYMLAGYCLLWCYYPPPDVMAWFPIAFAGAEFLCDGRYRRGIGAFLVGSVLMILPGHPSSLLMAYLGLSVYVLLRLAGTRTALSRAAACGACAAAAFVWALAICAAQLFPFIEYLRHSELFIDRLVEDGVQHYSYSLSNLLSMWAPRLFGTEFEHTFWGKTNHTYLGMLYAGIPVWVGALLLLGRLDLEPRVRIRVRALLGVSALAVFFSTDIPALESLHRMPVLNGVRPAYYIAFAAFAFPLASSFALQAWVRSPAPMQALRRPVLAALVLAVVLWLTLLFVRTISPEYANALEKNPELPMYVTRQLLHALAIAAASLLILALCAVKRRRLQLALPLLCVALAGDHAAGIRGLLSSTPREHLFPETELTRYLQAIEKPVRVRFDLAGVIPGYAPLYGIEELYGYDAVYPKRFSPLFDSLNTAPESPAAPVLACRYVLFPERAPLPPGFIRSAVLDRVQVAEDMRALPRARLVPEVKEFSSLERLWEFMNSTQFDPERIVCSVGPVPASLRPNSDAARGEARITEWSWNAVTIETDAPGDNVLVLADAFYPGWEALVDGQPAPIFPAYELFRGVTVPGGRHEVRFRFAPPSFRYGMWISVTAIVASLAAGVTLLALKPRQRSQVRLETHGPGAR